MRGFPWISGAVLAGCAVFSYPGRDYVLIGLMLFLPLLDRAWRMPSLPRATSHYLAWTASLVAAIVLLVWRPVFASFGLITLFAVALPEEWFFRAYFMDRLGKGFRPNAIASILFALLHGLTHDWSIALLVFIPSLFYGWLYQRTRDLPLLILAHALSNLVFVMFLAQFIADFMGNSR
jgi:membrane protease YdiL (CAAX protease family)